MPIKAKRVDAERASQVARGQLSGGTHTGKNYFYYEGVKKRQMKERDGDHTSSSSSNESSRTTSPKPQHTSSSMEKNKRGDADSDEELMAAARERTRRFLYPESEKNYVPAPYHNERAEAYARFRDAQQQRRASAPADIAATSSADAAPPSRAPDTTVATAVAVRSEAARDVPATHTGHGEARRIDEAVAEAEVTPSPPLYETSSTSDPRKVEFYKLLNLIGEDVQRDWSSRATTMTTAATTASTTQRGTSTSTTHPAAAAAATAQVARTYRPPAQTFSELLDDALQQLYDKWAADHADDDVAVFVASDHTAEAFTLAATLASSRTRTLDMFNLVDGSPTRLSGAPPTLEELAITNAMLNGQRGAADAHSIAVDAQGQLNRFLTSVGWIERLVRDRRFIASAGNFLHAHHKPFLRYLAPTTSANSSLMEHDHLEFAAYQEFGSQFSDLLLRLLTDKVEDFDEAEFVEALYETPVTARTQFAAASVTLRHGTTSANNAADASALDAMGPQNVLSYPAWRIVLAMSSFESFFDWMMDYVREEYNVTTLDEEEQIVAVGGARGVRALLRSTYGDGTPPVAHSPEEPEYEAEDAPAVAASSHDGALFGRSQPLRPSSGPGLGPDGSASSLPGERAIHTPLTALQAPVRLSPSPPPSAPLQPLARPDSSPPFGTTATSSAPPSAQLHNKFFPTPPASADGRVKQSAQKARLGQRLPPLTAKNLSEDPSTTTATTATTKGIATTTPKRKSSTTTATAGAVPARSKSGTKRSASQTKRKVSSAGAAKAASTSRRTSGVGSSVGSAPSSPSKAASTAATRVGTSGASTTKARTAARAPSKTKPTGVGTKPKLKRTTPSQGT